LLTFLEILLGSTALLLFLPATVLFVEVLCAVTRHDTAPLQDGERRRIAVLMPAHNEASIIAGTLRTIIPQLTRSDRLIVIADNCTDETAAIAAAEGAEAIVRTDLHRRGKGFALDFGIRHLKRSAPDVVMVIDADCQVATGSIDRLARLCERTKRPVQALYLMRSSEHAELKMRIAEFAWAVKNQVRPEGLRRLGLPCQLMGTGMAFPWSCINSANLATGHIVEDLKLGIDLARADTPPMFCPDALVTSDFPTTSEGIKGQRTRWEHGHLSVIVSEAPRLLALSLKNANVDLMALALDLSVPPLALLALQLVTVWFASALFFFLTSRRTPLIMMTVELMLLALSILMAWARYGRQIISFGGLAYAAVYPLIKIPLYLKFIVARQMEWVRSKRNDD